MIIAPPPPNEAARLNALRALDILDTAPEREYDDFVALASRICGMPTALIGLIDETRQWYKSKLGITATECPRDLTFCSHALLMDPPGLMEVPDARDDMRFHDNPAVTAEEGVRFYAGAPLLSQDRHVLGTLCVIDSKPGKLTSEQREALSALARQVSALMELRLARKELEARNRELERLNTENNQFVGMAAHDLRNPLQVIDGYGKLLLAGVTGPLTDGQRTALEAVTRNCGFMLHLVNELLSITKVNAGALELDRTAVNLAALCARAVELNSLLAEPKNIRLDLQVEDDLPVVYADAFKLEQVLNNLLHNAIKFSHPGTTTTVTVGRTPPGTASGVRVAVRDEGQGIPAEDQARLFTPFARLSVKATAGEASTGLGLAIVKRIVEGHGGRLTVDSRPGEGSTFAFTLPG